MVSVTCEILTLSTGSLSDSSRTSLVSSLAVLVPTLQQDPEPVTKLLVNLLEGPGLPTFRAMLELQPETDLLAGLQAPYEGLNLVVLKLLSRTESPADVWLVAGKPDVVYALVELWLTTQHVAVAEQADLALKHMLDLDNPIKHQGSLPSTEGSISVSEMMAQSSGLIWRRIFKDKNIYGLLFRMCSQNQPHGDTRRTQKQITIAQGRLLELLSNTFYAPQIWESQLREVEQKYNISARGGLLEFAMTEMVDYENDLLMHIVLIEFYTKLFRSGADSDISDPLKARREVSQDSSLALNAMIQTGLHQRTLSYYLSPNIEDISAGHLYGPASQYVEAYAQTHTDHFRAHAADQVFQRLQMSLSSITRSAWAHQRAPLHDLRLVSSMPRQILLAHERGSAIMVLPTNPPNMASLIALGRVFHGPGEEDQKAHANDPEFLRLERASARALYFLLCRERPDFWAEVVKAASTIAHKDTAVAAVHLVKAIISATWEKLPASKTAGLLTEEQLLSSSQYEHLPVSGALAVMVEPSTMRQVLPWLLKGMENNSSDAFEVAQEKHEIIPILRARLQKAAAEAVEGQQPPESWDNILSILRHRERLGPVTAIGHTVILPAPEVGTMEL